MLNSQLVAQRLTLRNAYSYWAHEVEVSDGDGKWVRVDFMQFSPYGYNSNMTSAGVERGRFVCYEVKSCLADIKSGHGLNDIGDVNWIVLPIETYYKYMESRCSDGCVSVSKNFGYLAFGKNFGYLAFGKNKRGYPSFMEFGNDPMSLQYTQRKRSAAELLACMMRALVANSNHSDVEHRMNREVEPWQKKP